MPNWIYSAALSAGSGNSDDEGQKSTPPSVCLEHRKSPIMRARYGVSKVVDLSKSITGLIGNAPRGYADVL
jgi:hypothetical protein